MSRYGSEWNYHHLTPRCRGGRKEKSNLLRLNRRRHEFWHFIFGNRTLPEVICLLYQLVKKSRRWWRQLSPPKSKRRKEKRKWGFFQLVTKIHDYWSFVFGDRTIEEVLSILVRLRRIKISQGAL